MNVEISEKLIEDSQRIDAGIRRLQNKLSDVIDRITDKNADPKQVIEKYKTQLSEIKTELTEFLNQQMEFDQVVEEAEKEVAMVNEEIKKILTQYNIKIDESKLKAVGIDLTNKDDKDDKYNEENREAQNS